VKPTILVPAPYPPGQLLMVQRQSSWRNINVDHEMSIYKLSHSTRKLQILSNSVLNELEEPMNAVLGTVVNGFSRQSRPCD
jgi:hypothetical protein